jgi:hypothetical protein
MKTVRDYWSALADRYQELLDKGHSCASIESVRVARENARNAKVWDARHWYWLAVWWRCLAEDTADTRDWAIAEEVMAIAEREAREYVHYYLPV